MSTQLSARPTAATQDVSADPSWTRLRSVALSAAVKCTFPLAPRKTAQYMASRMCMPSEAGRRRAKARGPGSARLSFETLDGNRTALYHWGRCKEQPYILSSHGWDSSGCWFQPWAEPLRQAGYALVAVDQPAHGYSDGARANVVDFACVLFAVAARLGPPAGLVGHSLGGLAAALALREGFAASRVVLVAPATSIKEMLRERARMFGFPDSLRRELTDHFERETGEKLERLDLRSCAPDIATPALFICDEEDAESDWTQVGRAAMSWRYSRLMTTRGLGHRRILADPNVVREGVRWLATQKAAA